MVPPSRNTRRPPRRTYTLVILSLAVLLVFGGYAAVEIWPDLGAQAADWLRAVSGDQVVAQLEMTVFQAEDTVHGWIGRVGAASSVAPWAVARRGSVDRPTAPATRLSATSVIGRPLTTLAMATLA